MSVSGGGSREEGSRKASVDAAGREMLAGEITSESAKCTVIFSPTKERPKNSRGPSLLHFSERFLVSGFRILSNSSLGFVFYSKVKKKTAARYQALDKAKSHGAQPQKCLS